MLGAALETIGDPVISADLRGTVLWLNRAAEALTGWRQAEVQGQPLSKLLRIVDEAGIEIESPIARVLRGGSPTGAAHHRLIIAKTGRALAISERSTAVHDASGAIASVVVVLRQSEATFRTLFEKSAEAIMMADLETWVNQFANPAALRMFGHSAAEMATLRVQDIVPPASWPEVEAEFEALARGERTLSENVPLLKKDGTVFYADVGASLVTIDGRPMIAGFFRDVTEARRDEAERVRLTMAIEQAGEIVFVTDASGTIVYANPAFETATGYAPAEVLGRNPRLLKRGVQDAAAYRAIWAIIRTGKSWRGRLVNKRKDGTLYTQDGSISAVRDAAGAITSYVAVGRDITATLKLESQFLHAQKMEAVGRLAGGVAHDFNNILSVILSYAEMIGDGLKPDEPLAADMEEIKKAALRGAALTRQLLAFSRQQVLEPKVLRLDRIISGMEKMLRRLLGSDIELTLLPKSDLWNVRADAGRVEQILMNLAVNARDAMPVGGMLTIRTENVELDDDYARTHSEVRAGAYVQLAVTDTGVGMDQETLTRLFEPFFTTKELGKGTGLGLATVFGIVKQSAGHISVRSEPGQGTTFKIFFPRIFDAAEMLEEDGIAAEPANGHETILLVEDDDQVRTVAAETLRRQGFVVLMASNGGEALLICEQHPARIDLLLTDLVLPRMSGRQLAERLAPLRPAMSVMFMSGYTDDVVLQHGLQSSAVTFLQKPITPASLIKKVRQVLRRGPAPDPA